VAASDVNRVSFGLRYRVLAERHPEKTAIVFVAPGRPEAHVSWRTLDERSNRAARLLASRGVTAGSLVAVALPTCLEHYVATIGAWRLGACVLPLNPALPDRERDELLELARSWRPTLVVGEWALPDAPVLGPSELAPPALDAWSADALPDCVPTPGKAIGSGGSTGRSKIIVNPKPWAHVPGAWGWLNRVGMREGQVQLLLGKLHHNMGFALSHVGLFEDHTLVVLDPFDAALAVDLIERHRVNFGGWAPITMQRMARVPDVRSRDFSSIEGFYHSAGPCPNWVKRVWVELVPPERQWNAFGSAEDKGGLFLRGDEWLADPTRLGRPWRSEVRILDAAQREVPVGQVGEIYMRNVPQPFPTYPEEPTYEYIGSPPARHTADGFYSVGDLGFLDDQGWVVLADRRVDMIVSGGSNVYPAEVEGALSEHPAVSDVVVVGVPDAEWGRRVHAVIEPVDPSAPPDACELDTFCRTRLVSYKVPKSYEFVDRIPRETSGKVRRSAIAAAREQGWTRDMIAVGKSTPAGA
jgi:bile acid-coenzyme A ligase